MMTFRLAAVFAVCSGLIQVPVASVSPPTPAEAERFRLKLQQIQVNGESPGVPGQARHTVVTEREINAYLFHDAREMLPAGVSEPVVTLPGEGRIEARAVVQLGPSRQQGRQGERSDTLGLLAGKVPVAARGRLRTGDGLAKFELESASISGVPVPPSLLQELLTYYSRGPETPDGFRLDDEFILPTGIREVRLVGRGHALVVQ